jgi:glutamate--cysteine ligase
MRAWKESTAETPYTAYSYLEGGLMAVINAFAQDAVDRAEPLTVATAYAQCRDAALAESAIGAIALEIESHLVDLDHVADPGPGERVEAIAAAVGKVAPGTAVTVEPGGQIELSGPPDAGVGPAVARLRYESTGARLALAERRLGLAHAGADPAHRGRAAAAAVLRAADRRTARPGTGLRARGARSGIMAEGAARQAGNRADGAPGRGDPGAAGPDRGHPVGGRLDALIAQAQAG